MSVTVYTLLTGGAVTPESEGALQPPRSTNKAIKSIKRMNSKPRTNSERERTDITSDPKSQAATPGRPMDCGKDLAILQAARELLFKEGLQAVTMESVARKAGVSKVTVYSRHANRNDLISAVMRQQAEVFSEALTPAQGSKMDVRRSLLAFSRTILDFLVSEDHLQFLRALIAAQGAELDLQGFYGQGPQNILEHLAHGLAAFAAEGQIQCCHPLRSAELFLGMLLRMDLVRALYGVIPHYSEKDLEEHAAFVVTMFLRLHGESSSEKGACDSP